MAKVKFRRNADVSVASVPVEDGQLLYNTETGETYEDVEGKRIQTGYKIDDAVINTSMTHSSKKVVDEICPEFTETGPVVTCHPVPGYPLHVVSKLAVQQEGSGDPSPENVRPFKAWDKVEMTRCGENLMTYDTVAEGGGLPYEINPGTGTVHCDNINSYAPVRFKINVPKETEIRVTGEDISENGYIEVADTSVSPIRKILVTKRSPSLAFNTMGTSALQISFFANVKGEFNVTQFRINIRKDEGFAPYTGQTYTAQLPPDTYGGEVDWEKGTLTPTFYVKTFDGSEAWINDNNRNFILQNAFDFGNKTAEKGLCSTHNYIYNYGADGVFVDKWKQLVIGHKLFAKYASLDEWKAELASHPMQVGFYRTQVANSVTTPISPLALPGVNTLYSSTGDTTVTGAEDPRHTIKALTDRVNALENQATGI